METLPKNSEEFDALVRSIKLPDDLRAKALTRDLDLTVDELLEEFCPYWHLIARILRLAKIFTRHSIDVAIDQIIAICDRLCGGATGPEQSDLRDKFAKEWPIVRPVLVSVKSVTGARVDRIIDEVLRVGDLLCN